MEVSMSEEWGACRALCQRDTMHVHRCFTGLDSDEDRDNAKATMIISSLMSGVHDPDHCNFRDSGKTGITTRSFIQRWISILPVIKDILSIYTKLGVGESFTHDL